MINILRKNTIKRLFNFGEQEKISPLYGAYNKPFTNKYMTVKVSKPWTAIAGYIKSVPNF